jgi:hypothetical protein
MAVTLLLSEWARPPGGTLGRATDVLDIRSALLKQNVGFGENGDML